MQLRGSTPGDAALADADEIRRIERADAVDEIVADLRPVLADRRVADVMAMPAARGEKIVTSVPRSRCCFSCAPSTLARI